MSYTAYVLTLVQQAKPDATARVKRPLTLQISGLPGGQLMQMNLDSDYSYCRRVPERCDERLAMHIEQTSAVIARTGQPFQRADLRAIVRSATDVKGYDELYKAQGGVIAEPLVGDLWVLCAVDAPGAIRILDGDHLGTLSLSRRGALALCKNNVAEALSFTMPFRRDHSWRGVNFVSGDPYVASWLISPDLWTAIADGLHGDLLVAAPGADIVLYASGAAPDAASRLAEAAAYVAQRAQKPLSTSVFRWTPTGWEEAKP